MRSIALFLMKRLPASIEYDDLYQAGCLGLLRAAETYDESRGVEFKYFAMRRVKGAMLDSIRRNEWVNANHLPITDDVLEIPDPGAVDVVETIEHAERARILGQAREGLGEREQKVIEIYFDKEQRLKGVGRKFGVKQSRSSQLLQIAKEGVERELGYRGLKRAA